LYAKRIKKKYGGAEEGGCGEFNSRFLISKPAVEIKNGD